ncbi:hypothetical protein T7377_09660 [Bradyrhizobium diazoefficiens]|nr:hypothetical protein [Bradyrhizobium diazoefficiens]WRJ25191.1 hypothetical protein T7377_09660 [Bradyrhizobium diazoefficiens]
MVTADSSSTTAKPIMIFARIDTLAKTGSLLGRLMAAAFIRPWP